MSCCLTNYAFEDAIKAEVREVATSRLSLSPTTNFATHLPAYLLENYLLVLSQLLFQPLKVTIGLTNCFVVLIKTVPYVQYDCVWSVLDVFYHVLNACNVVFEKQIRSVLFFLYASNGQTTMFLN